MGRLRAWLPSVAVAAAGAGAWAAAMTDHDALASRVHAASVLVAFAASALAWAAARRWRPLLLALAAKIAVFLALAPAGPATLTLGYAALSQRLGAHRYFWLVPPLLLAVTLAEGWWLTVLASGRSPRDTLPWRWRRVLVPAVLLAALAGGAWWQWRADYYLWRVRAHDHGPSRYALEQLGPRALPRVYAELRGLGERSVGEYRSDLARVVRGIRYGVVAREIGSRLIEDVRTARVPSDPAVVDALAGALLHEPLPEQRAAMADLSELDVATAVDLFCRVFGEAPPDVRGPLLSAVQPHLQLATGGSRDRGLPARRRERLRCAVPLLLDALETTPEWGGEHGWWVASALQMVGTLTPTGTAARARAERLLGRAPDAYYAQLLVDHVLGAPGLEDPRRRAMVARAYLAAGDGARLAIEDWVADAPGFQALFCAVFREAPAGAQWRLLEGLMKRLDAETPACVGAALMEAYEDARPPYLWHTTAERALATLAPDDPRVAPWAAALARRLGRDDYRYYDLLKLAP